MCEQPIYQKDSQNLWLCFDAILDSKQPNVYADEHEFTTIYRDVVIVGDVIQRFQRYHDLEFIDFNDIMTWNSTISTISWLGIQRFQRYRDLEFNDCNNIVQTRHVNFGRYRYNRWHPHSSRHLETSCPCGIALRFSNVCHEWMSKTWCNSQRDEPWKKSTSSCHISYTYRSVAQVIWTNSMPIAKQHQPTHSSVK